MVEVGQQPNTGFIGPSKRRSGQRRVADRARLTHLYQCWFSEDEVVRLRVSSAMKRVTIAHPDWIVLNNSMQVLHEWSLDDPALAEWLTPHLERLTNERRTSVARRAGKLLAKSKRT